MSQTSLAAVLILLTRVGIAAADESLARVSLAGESVQTARRLASVDTLLEAKQWAQAVKELQRILEEAGDDLVPGWKAIEGGVRVDRRHCQQARWLCHLRLAALPAPALELYRQRVDPQARALLDLGRKTRDPAVLRSLVEKAFCARCGGEALDLLGDLAFERGELEEAERCWRFLSAPATLSPEGTRQLQFPDSRMDPALMWAKQLLARVLRGEPAGLEAFRAKHPDAVGLLAGRRGNLAAILEEVLRAELSRTLPGAGWSTFAGTAERQGVSPLDAAQLRSLLRPGRATLLTREGTGEFQRRTAAAFGPAFDLTTARSGLAPSMRIVSPGRAGSSLAFHPAIADGFVFVADARRVTAISLMSDSVFQYQLPGAGAPGQRTVLEPDALTLTISEGRVYARLGQTTLGQPAGETASESFLVCLELDAGRRRFQERWRVKAPREPSPAAVFEGASLVRRGRAYAALTRVTGERARTTLACYDAATGTLRWQRDVCESDEFRQGHRRTQHHLLTWASDRLVYCTHSGAVVAVEAETGRPLWAFRYPSRGPAGPSGRAAPRGLAPCLYAQGRVFVAPADHGRVFCLDAETGHLLWESNPLEVVHLLGVEGGRLIVTAATPYPCLRALDARTGADLRGLMYPDEDAGLAPFGRGLLAGGVVLWPTTGGLRILDVATLRPRADVFLGSNPLRENVVAAEGYLVVAGQDRLILLDLVRPAP